MVLSTVFMAYIHLSHDHAVCKHAVNQPSDFHLMYQALEHALAVLMFGSNSMLVSRMHYISLMLSNICHLYS